MKIASLDIMFLSSLKGGGGGGGGCGVKAKSFCNRISFKIRKVGGGKSIHLLKALFKTYSKINVCWLLLSK